MTFSHSLSERESCEAPEGARVSVVHVLWPWPWSPERACTRRKRLLGEQLTAREVGHVYMGPYLPVLLQAEALLMPGRW